MNKEEAKKLVVNTFEHSFNEPRFSFFIKNLLNDLDESKAQTWSLMPEAYRDAIKSYKRLGQYTDKNKNVIDVLAVNVKRDNTLERARTVQRNFIARHLKQRNHEAALVAFYTDDCVDWRFSLVIMELNLTKTKVETEFSPAKRYSFLVGVNERSHTAQNQFVSLLTNKNDRYPLSEIEEAFNIETVTKEFFVEYRDLFIRTKTALDKILGSDSKVKEEFDRKKIDSVNFSKKLLGQIVFLYFLQKKGWFGVARDDRWGEGSKKFLRELLDGKHGKFNNFFNDILEPLFYEALRIDRSHDDHYYSRFNCKIPFLNGGLFDPIGDYNWVQTDITLPNELFSNTKKTTAGDIGDGILDIFDRYNFTVIEDEPLEKEVAIDPELLGKAYEKFNAIRSDNFDEYLEVLKSGKKGEETKFNKQYGVYYTPREIVHYMCRESLINYLASEFGDQIDSYQKIDLKQLDAFGKITRKGQLPLEAEYKSVPYITKADIETLINYGESLGENEAVVEAKGKETDTYYYKLPESIRTNAKLIDQKLSNILICDPAVGSGAFPVGMMHEIVSTRNILSIFIKDSSRSIYRFKRECIEKSLYGVDIDAGAVEIAKLRLWLSLVVDEDEINNIKPLPNLDYKIVCGNSLIDVKKDLLNAYLFDELEKFKLLLFNETNPTKKQEYKKQISELILKISKGHIDFDFEIYFSEVFHNSGGFHIVIGNPPYGIVYDQKYKTIYEELYATFQRNNDIYVAFYQRGLSLVKTSGILCFISANTFMNGDYFRKLRKHISRTQLIIEITDYKNVEIFENATVYVCIFLSLNKKCDTDYFTKLKIAESTSLLKEYSILIKTNSENEFRVKDDIQIKLDSLRNLNVIDNLFYVKDVGFNYWSVGRKKTRGQNSIGDRVFYSGKKKNHNDIPFLKGRNIFKYYIEIPSNYLKHNYEESLFENDIFRFSENFLKVTPKIVYRQTSDRIIAAIDNHSHYLDKTAHLIIPKYPHNINLKYLLGLLNSKFFNHLYKYLSQEEEGRAFSQVKTTYIKKMPVLLAEDKIQNDLVSLIDKVINLKISTHQHETKLIEDQIDIMVYKLYNLNYVEVNIIDPNIGEIISEEEYEKFEIKE
jgi:hypothetical protein